MRQLDTENADRDLTNLVTVLTHTPDADNPRLCQGLILFGDGIKDLDGTGGDFDITITVGGQTLEPNPQTVTFSTATRTAIFTTAFPVPANTEVLLRVKSPNAADSDVDVTAYLYDVAPLQPTTAAQTIDVDANGEVTAENATGATAAEVWANATRTLTQSATAVNSAVSGSTITVHRGDTLSASLTGLGSVASRTKLWFTAKGTEADPDSAAVIQIEETAGLLCLQGVTAGLDTAAGGITVDDEDAGDITITLDAEEAATLVILKGGVYDIQQLTATGVDTVVSGTFEVSGDVTRAVE